MRKIIYLITVLSILSCGTTKTSVKNVQNSYYPISGIDAKFKYADSDSYVLHKDLKETRMKNDKRYSVRQISYSWGKSTETLYRLDNGNVMYYDTKSNTENMIMPNEPQVGFKWQSTDKAWEYEIMDLGAELETPSGKYNGLLVMRATQITGRDQTKLTEYLNYYQKGTGKIASVGNGKLMTYRL